MTIVASAPAKLVLLGEYAVLEGAPAIVAAVDRRARVTLDAREKATAWHLESDLPEHPACEVAWNDEGVELRVLEAGAEDEWAVLPGTVVECVADDAGLDPRRLPPLSVRIESRALFEDEGATKLGLGSSAAVLVALAAGLRRHLREAGLTRDEPAPEDALLADLAIHAELQSGRGSGVDVAAATFGGMLAYAVGEDTLQVEPVSLPSGVVFATLWTGTPASTAEFLDRLEAFETRSESAYRRHMEGLTQLAARGLETCRADDAQGWLEVVRAWTPALQALGAEAGMDIVSAAHAELARIAFEEDAAYKPSGAGGGDVGLLFARSEASLAQTVRKAEKAGYRCVPLHVHPDGVRLRSL